MATSIKTRNAISKSNSPVKRTGLGNTTKKRLLKASQDDLMVGREKILMSARVCFARQGFAGTSMSDIQKESGFSRGNLYHHFKTKEDIVQIIIIQNLNRFCGQVEQTLKELKERDLRLNVIIAELAHLAEQITKGPGKGMAFHVWSLAMVDSDVRKTMVNCFENIRKALEAKIITLIDQRKIVKTKSTQELSVALFGLVIPAFTLQSVFMDEKSIDSKQYAKALEGLFKT